MQGKGMRDLRRIYTMAIALLLALGIGAGDARAGMAGPGETGVQIQNLSPDEDADITAEFYGYDGRLAHRELRREIAPGAATNFYLPGIKALADGAYAMIMRAERSSGSGALPIGAISRTDWPDSGGAAIYSNPVPDTDVIVPLVGRRVGRQATLVSIQNTDITKPALVTIEVIAAGSTTAVATLNASLPPAGATLVDFALDDFARSLPPEFVGMLRAKSNAPLAVQAFFDLEESQMAVSGFEGVPAREAAAEVFVPLFRSSFFGTTGISVVNPGQDSVEVQVRYLGSALATGCPGASIEHGGGTPAQIPAGGSLIFYQGGSTAGAGDPGLPAGCFGSAHVEVVGEGEGGVMAIVNDFEADQRGFARTAAAYNAPGRARGSSRVALPLLRNDHSALRLSSGIQVMNLEDAPATTQLRIFDESGNELPSFDGDTVKIAPLASHTWFLPALESRPLQAGAYGSGLIESDLPVVAIVAETSMGQVSDSVIYNAIPLGSNDAGLAEAVGGFSMGDYVPVNRTR